MILFIIMFKLECFGNQLSISGHTQKLTSILIIGATIHFIYYHDFISIFKARAIVWLILNVI